MRIVCLSAEAADLCARLGAWEEVVAVTAFAAQTGLPRRPTVGGFSTCDAERVAGFAPDLVITFSDVQADLAAALVRLGCTVLATNQRTLAEIVQTIRLIGGALGRSRAAEQLASSFVDELETLAFPGEPRPRVYFEEWPEPMISGIGWVGELIEHCGGVDVFAARRGRASRDRFVEIEEVIAADPELILASWCGKPVDLAAIRRRPGFAELAAIRAGEVHPLDSADILQPGPRVLEGARQIRRLLDSWRARSCIAAPARRT